MILTSKLYERAECWAVPLYSDLFVDYEPSLTVLFWLSDSVLHSQHELFYAPCRDIIFHLEHRWEQSIVTWNQRQQPLGTIIYTHLHCMQHE